MAGSDGAGTAARVAARRRRPAKMSPAATAKVTSSPPGSGTGVTVSVADPAVMSGS